MNRREFIKSLLVGSVGLFTPLGTLGGVLGKSAMGSAFLTEATRELFIRSLKETVFMECSFYTMLREHNQIVYK